MPKYHTHKVAKSDTPKTISKKYGHRDFKTIWTDKANKSLVSKRKKPEALVEGDVLKVPFNEKETKDFFAGVELLHIQATFERDLANVLGDMAAVAESKSKRALDRVKQIEASAASIISYLDGSKRKVKTINTIQDATFFCATVAVQVGSVGMKARELARQGGETLAYMQKDLAVRSAFMAGKPFYSGARLYNPDAKPKGYFGHLLKVVSDLANPSGWSNKFVALRDGKGLVETMHFDLQKEIDGKIATVRKELLPTVNKAIKTCNDHLDKALEWRKGANAAAGRAKALVKEEQKLLKEWDSGR